MRTKRRFATRIIALGLVALGLAPACSGRKGSAGALEAIAECEAYARAFTACTGREPPMGTEVIPKSGRERAQMSKLCAVNLKRIKLACR
ncbi:MAG: hypothetical protein ACREJ3_09965 [Polyangiaceae bacterium]